MSLNVTLITEVAGTVAKSSDVNTNNAALNGASAPTFSTLGLSGPVQTVGGVATAGGLGVPAVVAYTPSAVSVTTTPAVTVLSYAPPANGFYRISGWLRRGNLTVVALTFSVSYVDAATGGSRAHYGSFLVDNIGPVTLNGSNNTAGLIFAGLPMLIFAATGTNIVVAYQDPSGTPSDQVTAVIERLA